MRALWAACGAAESRVRGLSTAFVLLLATLLRLYVGTQPHSGQASPPKFGDYEVRRAAPPPPLPPHALHRCRTSQAQRHWMARSVSGSAGGCFVRGG